MEQKGKNVLKAAGILSVILGIIAVFAGFYIMINAMLFSGSDTIPTDEEYRAMRYLNLGGIYILAFGIVFGFAGFVGTINAGEQEYAKKCIVYAAVMLLLCLFNILFLLIWGDITTTLSMLIAVVPTGIAFGYTAGAAINLKGSGDSASS